MEGIIMMIILTASNIWFSILNYRVMNYKTSMFNAFCAGFCSAVAFALFAMKYQ